MNTIMPRNILVLENEGLVRSGMKALIQIAAPTACIHEASDYEQAISVLSNTPIDIAFLDYELASDKTGFDVLKHIRESESDTNAIMLSGHDDKDIVIRCIEAGACGFIPKSMNDDGVFSRALDTIFHGGVYLPSYVFGRGGDSPSYITASQVTTPADTLGIKGRMLEVLYYICQGHQNKVIAAKMGISEGTIRKDYVSKLLSIFKVTRRTQLVIEVSRRCISIPKPAALCQPE